MRTLDYRNDSRIAYSKIHSNESHSESRRSRVCVNDLIGMAVHELPPTDCVYWLRLSFPLGESCSLLLHLATGGASIRRRRPNDMKTGNLAARRYLSLVYVTTFPPSYLVPASLVPESISTRRYGIAPNLSPRPASGQPTLYHEEGREGGGGGGTTREENGSLFAGNDEDRSDSADVRQTFAPSTRPSRRMQILVISFPRNDSVKILVACTF